VIERVSITIRGESEKGKKKEGGEGEDCIMWWLKRFQLPSSGIERGGEKNYNNQKVFCRHMGVVPKRFFVTIVEWWQKTFNRHNLMATEFGCHLMEWLNSVAIRQLLWFW
jgi:hypothetical protein